MRGRGIAGKKATGDLIVTVDVVVPTALSDAERSAIEQLAAASVQGAVVMIRRHTRPSTSSPSPPSWPACTPRRCASTSGAVWSARPRTQGGNRRYSDADIETLRRIAELAAEGMNLEGIRRVMQLEAENQRLRAGARRGAQGRVDSASLVPIRQPLNVFEDRDASDA